MKLTFSPRLAFRPQVRIAAIELGLIDKIEFVPTTVVPGQPNDEYSNLYPLKKLPALILDNGDHRRFLRHRRISRRTRRWRKAYSGIRLDAMEGQRRPFAAAGHARFDAAVPLREDGAPKGCNGRHGQTSLEPGVEGMAHFEKQPDMLSRPFDIAQIGLTCVLGYADFRFADCGWRSLSLDAFHERCWRGRR